MQLYLSAFATFIANAFRRRHNSYRDQTPLVGATSRIRRQILVSWKSADIYSDVWIRLYI